MSTSHAVPANAELVWHGPIAWNLEGTVAVAAQDEQDQPVDLIEAYRRPGGRCRAAPTRFSVRAGMFWPPVSLEHEGPAWQVADMITPSAINSWIGEEVKVVGLEGTRPASARRRPASPRRSACSASTTPPAPCSPSAAGRCTTRRPARSAARRCRRSTPSCRSSQPPWTTPTLEVDSRPGFYGRLAWQMAAPVTLEAFYYANRGDPEAITPDLQWGWDTRFLNLGARIDLGAQHPHPRPGADRHRPRWARIGERRCTGSRPASAPPICGSPTEIGPVALSGRVDLFDTRQRGSQVCRRRQRGGLGADRARSTGG